jgi:hypothetical protein
VRETYRAQFQPSVEALSNRYVWYGTHQLFDSLTLTFREYQWASLHQRTAAWKRASQL